MRKILSKYKKWIITFSFAYIYIVAILLIPSNYRGLTPGETTNINNLYQIEDVEFKNDLNTVSVYSWNELTMFQKWIMQSSDRYYTTKKTTYQSSLSRADLMKQGKISNESSHQNAIITGYNYAGLVNNDIKIDYNLQYLTVHTTVNENLLVGDQIIGIDNVDISNHTNYETYLKELGLYTEIGTKINQTTTIQDTFIFDTNSNHTLNILRDGKEVTVELMKNEILYFYPKYNIKSTTPKYQGIKEEDVGGPSGGMIQALAIYSSLLEINFNNLKIAGTGTIDSNLLSTVGPIGGVVQKYFRVKADKVDYFIIPEANKEEVLKVYKETDKVKLIIVKDFNDLIVKFVNEVKSV